MPCPPTPLRASHSLTYHPPRPPPTLPPNFRPYNHRRHPRQARLAERDAALEAAKKAAAEQAPPPPLPPSSLSQRGGPNWGDDGLLGKGWGGGGGGGEWALSVVPGCARACGAGRGGAVLEACTSRSCEAGRASSPGTRAGAFARGTRRRLGCARAPICAGHARASRAPPRAGRAGDEAVDRLAGRRTDGRTDRCGEDRRVPGPGRVRARRRRAQRGPAPTGPPYADACARRRGRPRRRPGAPAGLRGRAGLCAGGAVRLCPDRLGHRARGRDRGSIDG